MSEGILSRLVPCENNWIIHKLGYELLTSTGYELLWKFYIWCQLFPLFDTKISFCVFSDQYLKSLRYLKIPTLSKKCRREKVLVSSPKGSHVQNFKDVLINHLTLISTSLNIPTNCYWHLLLESYNNNNNKIDIFWKIYEGIWDEWWLIV